METNTSVTKIFGMMMNDEIVKKLLKISIITKYWFITR